VECFVCDPCIGYCLWHCHLHTFFECNKKALLSA
jgi:hypothetical protein